MIWDVPYLKKLPSIRKFCYYFWSDTFNLSGSLIINGYLVVKFFIDFLVDSISTSKKYSITASPYGFFIENVPGNSSGNFITNGIEYYPSFI
jgi:hypothetical protein